MMVIKSSVMSIEPMFGIKSPTSVIMKSKVEKGDRRKERIIASR